MHLAADDKAPPGPFVRGTLRHVGGELVDGVGLARNVITATHSGRNVATAVASAAVATAFGNAHVIPYSSRRHHENWSRLLRNVQCWKRSMTKVMMPALPMALTAPQNSAVLPNIANAFFSTDVRA